MLQAQWFGINWSQKVITGAVALRKTKRRITQEIEEWDEVCDDEPPEEPELEWGFLDDDKPPGHCIAKISDCA